MWTIDLPLSVDTTYGKPFYLNMNVYRNAHHMQLSKAKRLFLDDNRVLINVLPKWERISIDYVLFPATKRRTDTSNPCSIVDKFFCDALVELGKIPDDSYNHVVKVSYSFGGVDPKNPRVEATIRDEKQMESQDGPNQPDRS